MKLIEPKVPLRGSKTRTWASEGINVYYAGKLNGDGPIQAPHFIDFMRRLAPKHKFEKALEWCGGPGFIGFSLLGAGICKRLCIADINPDAIRFAKRTVKENRLQDKVSCYVSDNFDDIPESEKFDLIVSNPPNYYALNPKHRDFGEFANDLRPNDRKWAIHKKFYSQVSKWLLPGGLLVIQEVEPFQTEVYVDGSGVPCDLRPRKPIIDFKKMISAGGLQYVGCVPFNRLQFLWFVISQKKGR